MAAAPAALPLPARAGPQARDELRQGLLPALLAHGGLLLALSLGVNWKSSPDDAVLSAELWAAVPQAAPLPSALAPAPVAAPAPVPALTPAPAPTPRPASPPPPSPPPRAPDIVTEAAKAKPPSKPTPREDAAAQRPAAAPGPARETKEAREQAQKSQAAAERQREENLRRMLGQVPAGAAGSGAGTAAAEAGPSASYRGRLIGAIRPNIVFTDPIAGNPAAEVALRVSPDGTVFSRDLVKRSGNAAWDEAVLRAIDRTERLPRDVDGRVPSSMVIVFRPSDAR